MSLARFDAHAAAGWTAREADGIVLHHAAGDSTLAGNVLRELLAGRRKVAHDLGADPSEPVQVYMAMSDAQFDSLTGGRIPHWGVGVAFSQTGTIVLKHRPGQIDQLLLTARHELSHILLHRAVSEAPSPQRVPVWFNEGVAMWSAGEWRFGQTTDVAIAVLTDGLIPLDDIDAVLGFASPQAQLAYTESYLAIMYLIESVGPEAVESILDEMGGGASFDLALFRVTGMTLAAFETAWMTFVRERFGIQAFLLSHEAIWFYTVLLVVLVWWGIRLRNRATLRRWEDEDPIEALPLRLRAEFKRRRDEV